MTVPAIGARVERTLTLDAASIHAGAVLVGDANPLHHDEAYARASRYGGLIASGAHTAAVLAGVVTQGVGVDADSATRPDRGPGAVGVDYQVKFLAPVRAEQALRLEWAVVAHEPRRSGTLVRLEGKMTDTGTGTVLLDAAMTVLYFA